MIFARLGDPGPFTDYRSYKRHLQPEFCRVCAYCEVPDGYYKTDEIFGVEHFRPKKHFPELDCQYENLYYCCNACNRFKGALWPTEDDILSGRRFVDPCIEDLYASHVSPTTNDELDALTVTGTFVLGVIKLNRKSLVNYRRRREQAGVALLRLKDLFAECRARALALNLDEEARKFAETTAATLGEMVVEADRAFLEAYQRKCPSPNSDLSAMKP